MTGILKLFALVGFLKVMMAQENKTKCFSNGICLAKDYDKHKPALQPITVVINIHINQVTEVDDALGTVDVMAYFEFVWVDNRLTIGNSTFRMLHMDWYDKLWFPDIYLSEMKDINLPQLNNPHMSDYMGKSSFFEECIFDFVKILSFC